MCHQPPTATLIFTTMQIQAVMVSLPRGTFQPKGSGCFTRKHSFYTHLGAPNAGLRPLTSLIPQGETQHTDVNLLYADLPAWSLQHPSAVFSGCDGDVQPTVVNIYETCWCH